MGADLFGGEVATFPLGKVIAIAYCLHTAAIGGFVRPGGAPELLSDPGQPRTRRAPSARPADAVAPRPEGHECPCFRIKGAHCLDQRQPGVPQLRVALSSGGREQKLGEWGRSARPEPRRDLGPALGLDGLVDVTRIVPAAQSHSGHPGGSISSGRLVASTLFDALDYDLAHPDRIEFDLSRVIWHHRPV